MSDFETWWEREGQEFLYALNTTTDDDIKLVAEVAWENGVYCTEQAEQEPVAFQMICPRCKVDRVTTPCPNRGGVSDCPMTATAQNAAPVRTKDLTDGAIWEILETHPADIITAIRAVIAADRRNNK